MGLRVTAAAQRRLSEIQSRLLLARRTAELSQEKVSTRAKVSSRALQDWEKGFDSPNLDHLISWAYELGFRLALEDPSGTDTQLPPLGPEADESWETSEMRRLVLPLRSRRLGWKLSQADLGLLIGVSRSSLQRWEDVQMFPRSLALIVWASRLEFTVDLQPTIEQGIEFP
jgi:transcriptional regulator with XRE-family HTH domain